MRVAGGVGPALVADERVCRVDLHGRQHPLRKARAWGQSRCEADVKGSRSGQALTTENATLKRRVQQLTGEHRTLQNV